MNNFICCPKCNYQYLPGEIFDPKYFLGQPKEIIRNNLGEILGYEGIHMDNSESFVCESCGCEFEVSARITLCVTAEDGKSSNDEPRAQQMNLF